MNDDFIMRNAIIAGLVTIQGGDQNIFKAELESVCMAFANSFCSKPRTLNIFTFAALSSYIILLSRLIDVPIVDAFLPAFDNTPFSATYDSFVKPIAFAALNA